VAEVGQGAHHLQLRVEQQLLQRRVLLLRHDQVVLQGADATKSVSDVICG
jgi:hypothetical protein